MRSLALSRNGASHVPTTHLHRSCRCRAGTARTCQSHGHRLPGRRCQAGTQRTRHRPRTAGGPPRRGTCPARCRWEGWCTPRKCRRARSLRWAGRPLRRRGRPRKTPCESALPLPLVMASRVRCGPWEQQRRAPALMPQPSPAGRVGHAQRARLAAACAVLVRHPAVGAVLTHLHTGERSMGTWDRGAATPSC